MKSRFSLLAMLLTIIALGTFTGCKKEGCTDPLSLNYDPDAKKDDGSCTYAPPHFVMHVHNFVGNQAFSTASTYTHASGRQFKFTKAHVYLSGIEISTSIGHAHVAEYAQIVAPESDYDLGELAQGSYTGMKFNIGLDSNANHSDPLTYATGHPLAATSTTFDHWSWNSGYIFLKIEGLADTSAAMTGVVDGPFEMHIGGDSYLRPVTLTQAFDMPVTGNFEFAVDIDWAKALDGVDLRHATTHTMDNMMLADQVMANFLTGIHVE